MVRMMWLVALVACTDGVDPVETDTGVDADTDTAVDVDTDTDTDTLQTCDYIDANDWAVWCDSDDVPERLVSYTSASDDPDCPDHFRLDGNSDGDANAVIVEAGCDDTCVYQRFQAVMVLYCDTRSEYITYEPGGPGQEGDGAECPPLIHGMTVAGSGWAESWEAFQTAFPCPGNAPPVVADVETSALVWSADSASLAISETLTISDADDTELIGATVRITEGFEAGWDQLMLTTRPVNLVGTFDSRTGTYTLSGTSDVLAYQNAVRSIAFTTTAEASGTKTLTIQVSDGDSQSAPVSRDVQVIGPEPQR